MVASNALMTGMAGPPREGKRLGAVFVSLSAIQQSPFSGLPPDCWQVHATFRHEKPCPKVFAGTLGLDRTSAEGRPPTGMNGWKAEFFTADWGTSEGFAL